MRRATLALSLSLLAPATARAQGDEQSAERCLQLGRAPSSAVAEAHARWLPPRPITFTAAASASIGPGAGLHGGAMLRSEVSRWAPFYTAVQARGFLGERGFVVLDALVGIDLLSHRGTFWRAHASGAHAPWDLAPPDDPGRAEVWLRERARDCGLSQGTWRLLGGARMLFPLDRAAPTPSSQFAIALGAARVADSYADGTRTGLDVSLIALFDPLRLHAGIQGRVGATWNLLYVGLEGAWILGPEGYGFATLDIGMRLSR